MPKLVLMKIYSQEFQRQKIAEEWDLNHSTYHCCQIRQKVSVATPLLELHRSNRPMLALIALNRPLALFPFHYAVLRPYRSAVASTQLRSRGKKSKFVQFPREVAVSPRACHCSVP